MEVKIKLFTLELECYLDYKTFVIEIVTIETLDLETHLFQIGFWHNYWVFDLFFYQGIKFKLENWWMKY